jgi:poly(ADP-ribose) glycohydrolase
VLGEGCVQEEIRFSICLETNECVLLIGCERFSKYKGYADSFAFAGDFRDETMKSVPNPFSNPPMFPPCSSRDEWGRKWCHVVAMDAIYFRDPSTQYDMRSTDRELTKAYISFLPVDGTGVNHRFGIATGNWGCGAFNGDKQLKGRRDENRLDRAIFDGFLCPFSAHTTVSCICSESSIDLCCVRGSTFGAVIC